MDGVEERKNETPNVQSIFAAYDPQNTGKVQKSDLQQALQTVGDASIISKVEDHKEDQLDLNSFVDLFRGTSVSDATKQALMTKAGKIVTQVFKDEFGSYHSYSPEECSAFVNVINHSLQGDADLAGILPINPESDDLFAACGNGILLCKLINAAVPGTIFEKAINIKQNLNIFQIKENLNLAINAAKSIGCVVINIDPESIVDRKEYLILGLLWQIIKILMLSAINLKNHPELIKLVQEGEELSDLLKLPPEALLLRWFNYHLQNAGHARRVNNFGADVKDAECYTVLLHQIDPAQCDLAALNTDNLETRAGEVINSSKKLGVETSMRPRDITGGNSKVNMLFAASIFNTNPGLHATEEELFEAAALIEDDVEGTREERAFRMWINSLNAEGVYINNLYEEVKDGLALLKIIDTIEPGSVNWKRVEKNPNHRLKKISNGNMVIEVGKALKFTLVGIGGMDIVDGNRKLILAYVWQLVRYATLKLVGGMSDDIMLKMANERTGDATATSFRDQSLSSGRFLLNLFGSIEPRAINWELVAPGETPEEKEQNAKYVLSVARKLGASVFCVWEDIVEVKPKMIMTLIAAAIGLASQTA